MRRALVWVGLAFLLWGGTAVAVSQEARSAEAGAVDLPSAGQLLSAGPELRQDDALFLAAREAFRLGMRGALEGLAQALRAEKHPLADYAEYYLLMQDLDQRAASEVEPFIARQSAAGAWLGEKMRADWLRALVKRQAWRAAVRQADALKAPDQETRCLAVLARLHLRQAAGWAEARSLWGRLTDPSRGCQELMQAMSVHMDTKARWARIRLLFERNRPEAARSLWLSLPDAPSSRQFDAMLNKPATWLTKLPQTAYKQKPMLMLASLALQRMAANDPEFAANQMPVWGPRLEADDRAWVWGQIAQQGGLRHLDAAAAWYRRSHPAQLSREGMAWRVRVALRRQDWAEVRASIEAMPPDQKALPDWIYWRARAEREKGGKAGEVLARNLFASIAAQPNFYGNLALEELGGKVSLPPYPAPLQADEQQRAEAHPGLQRALLLLRLGFRLEGLREWNWSVRGMDDRELLAAADLANRRQVFDRAIHAAERTHRQHDFRLRYLVPFPEQVRPIASAEGIDDAWIYGLMRQESRFVLSAKSSVGASGLMQLMPKTARWVAKKIGLADYDPARVHEPEVNLRLGVAYMRMVQEALDLQPLLASAAYNAGPGRARRWKAKTPLEGAVYAETIPFDETRDYVKKVMSNTLYYALLFDEAPASTLHARLGTVAGRDASAPPIALP